MIYRFFPYSTLNLFRSGLNSNIIVHSYISAKSVGNVLTGTTHDLEEFKIQPDNRITGVRGTNGYYVKMGI